MRLPKRAPKGATAQTQLDFSPRAAPEPEATPNPDPVPDRYADVLRAERRLDRLDASLDSVERATKAARGAL